MPTLARTFGILDDTTAGGKDYDALQVAYPPTLGIPPIPDANVFYPVTGGTFDPAIERIDRNDEVRGRRANTAPSPFRAGPMMTLPIAMYPKAAEKLFYKLLGAVSTTGGVAPVPYTHALTPTGFGTIALPAAHVHLIRDDLNIKMGGSTVNRITADFPLDGEGTMETEFYGKYFAEYGTAAPTPTFTGMEADTLMLRDAQMFIDGSATPVQDLQGFSFTYNNNLVRKWYAGRNIQTRALGTPTQTKKLWFPAENKAQAAADITYSMTFGNTVVAQEIAHWYAQTEKFVFEVAGGPIGGTYTGTELMRITIYNGVHTGGGAEALTAREDITATFEGGVFYSAADAGDLLIEFVTDTATLT
jgi:hypothetical protein